MASHKVLRAPLGGGELKSPFELDAEAKILAAQDFTVRITTVSQSLFTKFKSFYRAGEFDNNHFILLSRTGLGNPDKPTLKLHLVEHIQAIDSDITELWAQNVETVEDYMADGKKDRLFLSFHTFCQNLGPEGANPLEAVAKTLAARTGTILPTLLQFIIPPSTGRATGGMNNILRKFLEIPGECKKVEFSLFPLDSPAAGDAPLQTGAFILFFEPVEEDGGYTVDRSGIVDSTQGQPVPPYIVLNIERGITAAGNQIDSELLKVFEKHDSGFGFPLPEGQPSSLNLLKVMGELESPYQQWRQLERYLSLSAKPSRTEAEEARLKALDELLADFLARLPRLP